MDKKQLEQIHKQAKHQAEMVLEETQNAFNEIHEIMSCLQSDMNRFSSGGKECLANYWQMTFGSANIRDYTWRETIHAFKEINKIMDCLESDRDRLSHGGQDALHRYWVLRDNFISNRGGEVKEFLIS